MSKILKNTTGVPLFIADTGTLLPILPATFIIPPQDYWIWAASSDIVGPVGAGNVIVNDGSFDLNASDGMDLIKGIFPNPVRLEGATDGTDIGNTGDRLHVDAEISGSSGPIDVVVTGQPIDVEEVNPLNEIEIDGATDGTNIGNIGDRLKVTAEITDLPTPVDVVVTGQPIDTTETNPLGEIEIDGATDGTNIGNTGDRLNVQVQQPLNVSVSQTPADSVVYKRVHLLNGGSPSMKVNGSVAPVDFDFTPAGGETWYIEALSIMIDDSGNGTIDMYGALSALANGTVIKFKTEGTEYTFATLKTNGDIILGLPISGFVGGSGTNYLTKNGYVGTVVFEKTMKFQNSTSDYIRATVNDNLTGLDIHRISARLYRQI